jgi:hypothetical protein
MLCTFKNLPRESLYIFKKTALNLVGYEFVLNSSIARGPPVVHLGRLWEIIFSRGSPEGPYSITKEYENDALKNPKFIYFSRIFICFFFYC